VYFLHYTNIACLFFGFVFVCPSPSKQYQNGSRKNRPRKNGNAKALRDGEYRSNNVHQQQLFGLRSF